MELGKEMKPNESRLRADYDLTYREIYLRLKRELHAATGATSSGEEVDDE